MEQRNNIFEEAQTGRQLISTLYEGEYIFDPTCTPENVDRIIIQLMHLQQYAQMYKFFFNNWNDDANEQTYIEIAAETQKLQTLVNSDVFHVTLADLLIIKCEHSHRSGEEMYDEYMNIVGNIWLEAGLISGLKKEKID